MLLQIWQEPSKMSYFYEFIHGKLLKYITKEKRAYMLFFSFVICSMTVKENLKQEYDEDYIRYAMSVMNLHNEKDKESVFAELEVFLIHLLDQKPSYCIKKMPFLLKYNNDYDEVCRKINLIQELMQDCFVEAMTPEKNERFCCKYMQDKLNNINQIEGFHYKRPVVVPSLLSHVIQEYNKTENKVHVKYKAQGIKHEIRRITDTLFMEKSTNNVLIIPFEVLEKKTGKYIISIGFLLIQKGNEIVFPDDQMKKKKIFFCEFFKFLLYLRQSEYDKIKTQIYPYSFHNRTSQECQILQALLCNIIDNAGNSLPEDQKKIMELHQKLQSLLMDQDCFVQMPYVHFFAISTEEKAYEAIKDKINHNQETTCHISFLKEDIAAIQGICFYLVIPIRISSDEPVMFKVLLISPLCF